MAKMSQARKQKKLKEKQINKKQVRIDKIKISVAMMVKNEEHNIIRCLRSLVKLFDHQIVIVDTGSTDKTIEMIQKVAEHHPQIDLYHLKDLWLTPEEYFEETEFGKELNFSKTRNLTIDLCICDWLIVIDADEKVNLNTESMKSLNEFIVIEGENLNINSFAFALYDIHAQRTSMQFNAVRLFRKGRIHYEGRIHNRPIVNGDSVFCPYLYIFHYGYDLSTEQRKAKEERTCGLLEKDLADDPNNTRAMYFLVQSYAWHGRQTEAVKMGLKYLSYADKTGHFDGVVMKFNVGIYYTMIRLLVKESMTKKSPEMMKQARELLEEGLKKMPNDLDLMQCMTEWGAINGDAAYLQAGARGFMKAYEKFDATEQGENFVHTYTPDAYAYCVYQLARYQIKESQVFLGRVKAMLGSTEPVFGNAIAVSINKDLEEIQSCKIQMKAS